MTQCVCDAALVTQMRAGTHYMCAALRIGLEATIYRPDSEKRFVIMDEGYIRKGLHETDAFAFPQARPDFNIYFCHYYHPHLDKLSGKPRISLIGFPFDSFFSDGIVASHASNDPRPSGAAAKSYVLRYDSDEWRALETRMHENAEWLATLHEGERSMIVRYEDLVDRPENTASRLESLLGKFVNPVPTPTRNVHRSYWTENYAANFDRDGLKALWKVFETPIRRFYPERVHSLEAAL
jgi:hypothetical protein